MRVVPESGQRVPKEGWVRARFCPHVDFVGLGAFFGFLDHGSSSRPERIARLQTAFEAEPSTCIAVQRRNARYIELSFGNLPTMEQAALTSGCREHELLIRAGQRDARRKMNAARLGTGRPVLVPALGLHRLHRWKHLVTHRIRRTAQMVVVPALLDELAAEHGVKQPPLRKVFLDGTSPVTVLLTVPKAVGRPTRVWAARAPRSNPARGRVGHDRLRAPVLPPSSVAEPEERSWVRLRQTLSGEAIKVVVEGLGRLSQLHPYARPEAHGLEVEKNVTYGPEPVHRLDVWRHRDLPPGAPALLFIHGGGFRILSKESHWLMAVEFARAGCVVFTIDYRLAPRHPFPAALEDAALAYRWVVEHGADHGAAPHRLALSGESAGANLSLGLTLAACSRRPEPYARALYDTGIVPQGILPICGLFQVTEPDRFLAERKLPTLVADRIHRICADYLGDLGLAPQPESELADPLRLLERGDSFERPLPPTYLAVGSDDPIASDSHRAARSLEARGVPLTFDVYDGEPHAFHALLWRETAQRCWAAQRSFLERHLGAVAPRT